MDTISRLFSGSAKQSVKQPDVEMKTFSSFEDTLFDDKENTPSLNLGLHKLYDHASLHNIANMKLELDNIPIKIKEELDYCASKKYWMPATVPVLCVINNQLQTITVQERNGAVEVSLEAQPRRTIILNNVKSIANLHSTLRKSLQQ